MAGTISLSLSQQLTLVDGVARPLSGGKLYFFRAGTTTPQNAYFDSGLTLPHPNPIELDANGRVPQFFLADGQIKIRLTDADGITQIAADNILVIGPSSGEGGGGGTVDPTTVLSTGDLKFKYGTGSLAGFVRCNGRTVGSATSGASERANSDCQSLFEYLWGADANLAVSGGRGSTAAADWASNKAIALPDWRGRAIGALDDMGNSPASRLTSSYFGTSATVLGAAGGAESLILTQDQIPVIAPVFLGTQSLVSVNSTNGGGSGAHLFGLGTSQAGAGADISVPVTSTAVVSTGLFTPTGTIPSFGGGLAHRTVGPLMLATFYMKL